MSTTLQDTPSANRTHIAFFGRRNSGKSSLLNALTMQQVSIVSDVGGTTTDPVRKAMEIHGIGPCVLIDTAGFDDEGSLGEQRIERTRQIAQEAEIAVLVCTDSDAALEKRWYEHLRKKNIPVLVVLNKADCCVDAAALTEKLSEAFETEVLAVSTATGEGIDKLREALVKSVKREPERWITGTLLSEGDLVLLVMPQDIQAPKGRLILPQVQTLRELLDKHCLTMCVTTDKLEQSLAALSYPPKLIITDSQAYRTVYDKKPAKSRLTSFSTLFAAYKGDIRYFIEGAKVIDTLTEQDKVLIAECCTHAPLDEDIGRVKLPGLLKKKVGAGLTVDIVSGKDFPKGLDDYSLIIQCGACMFHRSYVMARVDEAKSRQVPMTNYGVAIAYMNGILDQVELTQI